MTDFEITYMKNEYVNTLLTTFISYVSIVFAFLVAAYLVAPRLNRAMSTIVLLLYTLATFYLVVAVRFLASNDQIIQTGVSPVVDRGPIVPLSELNLANTLELAVMVLAYVGSIAFFFQQRKRGSR